MHSFLDNKFLQTVSPKRISFSITFFLIVNIVLFFSPFNVNRPSVFELATVVRPNEIQRKLKLGDYF